MRIGFYIPHLFVTDFYNDITFVISFVLPKSFHFSDMYIDGLVIFCRLGTIGKVIVIL